MKTLSSILLTLLVAFGACTSPRISSDPFAPCVRRASDGEWKTLLLYWDQFLVWSHIGVTGAGG